MVEYLDTCNISGKISDIIKNAKDDLILVSPYLQVSPYFQDLIEGIAKHNSNLRIKIICRKNDLKKEEKKWIEAIPTIELLCKENLHAKCYMNEDNAIITSMNLYRHSQENNYEMGVLISKDKDFETYKNLSNDVKLIALNSESITHPQKQEIKEEPQKEIKLNIEQQKTFEMLKYWRLEKSKEIRKPAYAILKDSVLKEIIITNPKSKYDLKKIKGIAEVKINSFGNEIIETLEFSKEFVLVKVINTFIQYDRFEGYDRVKIQYLDTKEEQWLDTTKELPEKNKIVAVKINGKWFNEYFYI